MDAITNLPHLKLLMLAATLVGGGVILLWRVRETKTAISTAKIVMPPLGMATGFCMFLDPKMRVPLTWGLVAVLLGALLLAVPLQKTSKLTRRGDAIYLQRSKAFLTILIGLVLVRFALHDYLDEMLPPMKTAALFYLLAFGMIVRWRASMYLEFRRLKQQAPPGPPQLA